MSEEQQEGWEETEQPTAEELRAAKKAFEARIHRNMGIAALILGVVAAVVALGRMRTMFGVSAWEALGISAGGFLWVLLILAVGVAFSVGTSRIGFGIEKLVKLLSRKRP